MADGNNNELVLPLLLGVVMIAVTFGAQWVYETYDEAINLGAVRTAAYMLYPFAYLFEDARAVLEKLATMPAGRWSSDQILTIFRFTAEFWRWPVMVLFAGLVAWLYIARGVDRYRRHLTAMALVEEQAKHYPSLTPVVPRKRSRFGPKRSMLDEPLDSGPWRMARQPGQWVAEHGLLIEERADKNGKGKGKRRRVPAKEIIDPDTGLWNKDSSLWHGDKGLARRRNISLEHKRATELLTEQVGRNMPEDVHTLADHERALAAAFIRLAQGGGKKSAEANAIFDAVSASYDPDAEPIVTMDGVDSDIDAIIDEGMADEGIARVTEMHGHFVYTWLMGLLYAGGENQSIPPSQFLWLRVVDRTLWYALNQVGSRCAWMEASGSWAHYWAEHQIGRAIPDPQIDSAVEALDRTLKAEGWIVEPPKESPSANRSGGQSGQSREQKGRRESRRRT